MKRNFLLFTLALFAFGDVNAESLVDDGFESGDLGAPQPSGFTWDGNNINRTAVVSRTTREDGAAKPNGSDWSPYEGDYSLLLNYPAGEAWTEKRFFLGQAQKDLWISFWIRVPVNYTHNQNSPSNNKFLSVWMDDYSQRGDGSTVFWGTWSDGAGGSQIAMAYNDGGFGGTGGYSQYGQFITVPGDRGRWMRVVFHMSAESSPGAGNGVLEMWRKWEGDTAYTKFTEKFDADITLPESGPQGFTTGYLLGWSNPTYVEKTEWLIDSFKIATTNFADGPTEGIEVKPKSPVAR